MNAFNWFSAFQLSNNQHSGYFWSLTLYELRFSDGKPPQFTADMFLTYWRGPLSPCLKTIMRPFKLHLLERIIPEIQ